MTPKFRSLNIPAVLIAGIFCFALARLFMIFVSGYYMGLPRLGDDALIYISKGTSFYNGYNLKSKLRESVNSQLSIQDHVDLNQIKTNWRIANQAVGGANYLQDFFAGIIYKLTGNSRITFVIMETVIALIMTSCLAYFLIALWGQAQAGWTMFLISGLLLPGQGLHYLIPSTLALSLGFLLIAVCAQPGKRYWTILALSTCLAFIHGIGAVWICVAAFLSIVLLIQRRNEDRRIHIEMATAGILLALFVPLAIKFWLGKSVAFFSAPYISAAPPSGDLFEIIQTNFRGLQAVILSMPLNYKLLMILAVLSFPLAVFKRLIDLRTAAVTSIIVFLLVPAALVQVPFYPGEVLIRMCVAASIPLIAVLIQCGLWVSRTSDALLYGFKVGLIVLSAFFVRDFVKYIEENFERPYVIDDVIYKKFVSSLDSKKDRLFFLETEYSFRLSVANGDVNFESFHWPLLNHQSQGITYLTSNQSVILISPVTNSLNSVNQFDPSARIKRKIGFLSEMVSTIVLASKTQFPPSIQLFIQNSGPATFISVSTAKDETIKIPSQFQGWISVNTAGASEISISLNKEPELLLGGLNTAANTPPDKSNWPWGQDIRATIFSRKAPIRKVEVDFSVNGILKEHDAQHLLPNIQSFETLNDQSGILFAKVVWKEKK